MRRTNVSTLSRINHNSRETMRPNRLTLVASLTLATPMLGNDGSTPLFNGDDLAGWSG